MAEELMTVLAAFWPVLLIGFICGCIVEFTKGRERP